MNDRYATIRDQVLDTALRLCQDGLIRLSAGNISARMDDGLIALTPAGLLYSKMRPDDIAIVDSDGQLLDGGRPPSSESPMHRAVYRKLPAVGAVVHTHSIYAIALSVVGLDIPVVCLEVLLVGGPVPVAAYACPGTMQAGDVVSDLLADRSGLRAVLLRNHGLVAVGADLEEAYQSAVNCETAAQVYHLALQTGRSPVALSDEQIAEIWRVYKKA